MNKVLQLFLICIFILLLILLYKVNKAIKYNKRINKYTINNNRNNNISLGDRLLNSYDYLKEYIFNIINNLNYYKNKSNKYEK